MTCHFDRRGPPGDDDLTFADLDEDEPAGNRLRASGIVTAVVALLASLLSTNAWLWF